MPAKQASKCEKNRLVLYKIYSLEDLLVCIHKDIKKQRLSSNFQEVIFTIQFLALSKDLLDFGELKMFYFLIKN